MLKTTLFDLLISVVRWSPWRLQRLLGSIIGWFLWYANSRMARVSLENISICYAERSTSQQRNLARQSLVETGRTIVETAHAWKASQADNLALIGQVDNVDLVADAQARGKGLIFLLPHLGNWEILNHYLGKHYGLTHMYQPYSQPTIARLIDGYRNRSGTRFVSNDQAGIRAQLSTLRQGGCIGTMPDQEPGTHTGVFCDFFGTPALTSSLVSRLVEKTDCAVVTVHCQRLADEPGFKVVFTPTSPGGGVAALNNDLEAAIRQVPDQYLWSYKRFRTRPDGEAERYQFLQPTLLSDIGTSALATVIQMSRLVPLHGTMLAAKPVARLMHGLRSSDTRVARKNIALCFPEMSDANQQSLLLQSTRETVRAGLELGHTWFSNDPQFDALIRSVEGLEYLVAGPGIVLTPPIGNRELVMRYLGKHFHTTEYYHPNSSIPVDQQIRRQRARMGVALAEHTSQGQSILCSELSQNRLVTLCPDQQPRLRGGEFIDFFDVPALTTRFLSQLIQTQQQQASGCSIVFGVCIREGSRYRLHFHPWQPGGSSDDVQILATINQQLESIARAHAEQYRWQDKRFNIRPRGMSKLYR